MNESERIRKDTAIRRVGKALEPLGPPSSSGANFGATYADTLELHDVTPRALFESAISVIPQVIHPPVASVSTTAATSVFVEFRTAP
jgi:hypothetical protein